MPVRVLALPVAVTWSVPVALAAAESATEKTMHSPPVDDVVPCSSSASLEVDGCGCECTCMRRTMRMHNGAVAVESVRQRRLVTGQRTDDGEGSQSTVYMHGHTRQQVPCPLSTPRVMCTCAST